MMKTQIELQPQAALYTLPVKAEKKGQATPFHRFSRLIGLTLVSVFGLVTTAKPSHAWYQECNTYFQAPIPAYPCADAEALTGANSTTTQTRTETTGCSPSYSLCNACVTGVPVNLLVEERTVRCTDEFGAAIRGGQAGAWRRLPPIIAVGCVNGKENAKICNL